MSYLDRVVDNELCTLILETMDNGDVHAHLSVYQWSRYVYEELLLTWGDVLAGLRKKGVNIVYATAPMEEDCKTLRFQMMFGFLPIGTTRDLKNNEVYISEVTF